MVRIPFNRAEERGSMGTAFVLADFQVRVFWSSGTVDRPSVYMYIRTIPLSGYMYRRYHYTLHICSLVLG